MGGLSIWHWLLLILVVLLLFGRGKISDMMGDVAKGIKAFKKGMSDEEQAKTDAPADKDAAPADPLRKIEHQASPVTREGEPRKAG